MDTQSYSRLLSYIVCEMTMPIKKHVYNFAASDHTSMNPQLLSAATLVAKSQIKENVENNLSNPSNNSTNINRPMSDLHKESENEVGLIRHEIKELCEGTEIEKSALGDILNYENSNKTETEHNIDFGLSDYTHTSANEDEILNVAEENNAVIIQPFPKRKHYSINLVEDQPVQSVPTHVKDGVPVKRTKCLEETVNEILLSNNESNEENLDSKDNLYSDPLLLCSDNDFKVMFRVSRSTFQILVEMLSKEELEPIEDVPLYKKVLIVLWLLGSSGSYKDAAQVFEVSEEAVSSCFFDICATLYNKSENLIKWPSAGESDEIASRIEKNFGFPGVVGILGCQYFTISIPKETLSRREHFNGKLRMYCVALQLVCDDEFIVRDIFPGLPGGIRPAQVLRDSPLGELLTTQPTELIDPSKHILARSEFPQLTSMLTPYNKNSEFLTKDEKEFNTLHENVCLLVDHTFQMLKDRFRVLKLLDPEVATMVLVTTCVLHNICIQNSDTYDLEETD